MERDRHVLTNLSVAKKVLASAALVMGLCVFVGATLFELAVTEWSVSAAAVLEWGSTLMGVRGNAPGLFAALFAVHAAALVVVLATSHALFRHVAMPRGGRIALSFGVGLLSLLDLGTWASLGMVRIAERATGPLVVLLAAVLAGLAGRALHDMWIFARVPSGRRTRVVVVGGGFAGLYATLGLDRRVGYSKDVELIVLDQKNYFLFPPLLPSVAAGAIETRQVTYPFRRIFEATNVAFRKERVTSIDVARKTVCSRSVEGGRDLETTYDVLVLAPGSETNTFNTPGVAEHAYFMREVGDAVAVRNQVIDCFERAARETDGERRRELLSFVIVGAGPTGVELASEVKDLIVHVLLSRYPEIDPSEASVTIVQSADQILPGWNPRVVANATQQLRHVDVRLLLKRRVKGVDASGVTLDGGERLPARTCVWCAGVKPARLLQHCGLPQHKSGRVEIEPDLRVKGTSDVFVLGDAAYLEHRGAPLPPLGQVAFQQGSACADNIVRIVQGKSTKPFKYFNFGALVSVGEHFAAVDLLGLRFSGFVAWLVWRALYLAKLVGFGNKVRVLLDWSLDLLVERSISQIAASRQDLVDAKDAPEVKPAPAPSAPPPAASANGNGANGNGVHSHVPKGGTVRIV